MNQITIKHESIDEVRVDKTRRLIIYVKHNEEGKRLKKHLLKQNSADRIDCNVKK